eukprot:1141221-Pelagomonas_calceolata.AAC.3
MEVLTNTISPNIRKGAQQWYSRKQCKRNVSINGLAGPGWPRRSTGEGFKNRMWGQNFEISQISCLSLIWHRSPGQSKSQIKQEGIKIKSTRLAMFGVTPDPPELKNGGVRLGPKALKHECICQANWCKTGRQAQHLAAV